MKGSCWLRMALMCLVATLGGCAGYNHTLFMTKSNAGLDFDTKPPTAEITISRREAVIAPGFEGGQTPPVLASFKPNSGIEGAFANYFVGVDQTFAGGDAAVAMTTLYSSEASETNSAPYNSTLKLSKLPKHTDEDGCAKRFFGLQRPGDVRPFVFGTDTSLGLKVAWSGVSGQVPDTVKLGFNRKEFAWAPVTMTNAAADSATPYHVRMPAFLATIDSHVSAGSKEGTGIRAIQYFATGEAATQLAMKKPVRDAMLYRADPAGLAKAQEYQNAIRRIYAQSSTSQRLRAWINRTVPSEERQSRQDALKKWIPAGANYDFADLVDRADLEPQRQKFLDEKAAELKIP